MSNDRNVYVKRECTVINSVGMLSASKQAQIALSLRPVLRSTRRFYTCCFEKIDTIVNGQWSIDVFPINLHAVSRNASLYRMGQFEVN